MQHPFRYLGFFIPSEEFHKAVDPIRQEPLSKEVAFPHITIEFKPKKVDLSVFGKTADVVILGYGNDGINEGVSVRLQSEDPQLQTLISKIEVPHITISVSDSGKPVNTRFLTFKPVEPVILTAVLGGLTTQAVCSIPEAQRMLRRMEKEQKS